MSLLWLKIGLVCAVLYIPLQAVSIIRIKNADLLMWVLIPAPVMSGVYSYTLYAFFEQNNLWPLIMLFASPVAVLYLLILWGIQAAPLWLSRKPRK